jgi:hypothetical protein
VVRSRLVGSSVRIAKALEPLPLVGSIRVLPVIRWFHRSVHLHTLPFRAKIARFRFPSVSVKLL